jgi:hypothetical protein
MATPEYLAPQPEQSPDLRMIVGGLAVEKAAEPEPRLPIPFSELAQTLGEENWADMSAEELLEVREVISGYTGELAFLIHSLQQQYDQALSKKIWINGFIRDRL